MKKIVGLFFASLVIVAGLAVDSFAQSKNNRWSINSRQHRQQTRIYQGARSGRLIPLETLRLQRQQYQFRRTESRFRRSGSGLSWRERYILQRNLNRSSRSIYRQKHDRNNYPYSRRRL